MIVDITLKRFHSIPAAFVTFANPTFFVGCNGSGKSNLADAFTFLSEAVQMPLQTVFDRRGGIHAVTTRIPKPYRSFASGVRRGEIDTIGIGASFLVDMEPEMPPAYGRYAFEVQPISRFEFEVVREQCVIHPTEAPAQWYDRVGTKVTCTEPWMKPIERWGAPSALLMPLVGTIPPFARIQSMLKDMRVYSIEPAKLREAQRPDTGAVLSTDGGNATSVLNELRRRSPEAVARLEEILSSITPNIRRVWTIRQGKQLALKFSQRWGDDNRLDFDAFSMSDGTLRALGLLLALHQLPGPSVVVIEEPEATIHPGALGTILDAIRTAAKDMQIIVTTHSPDVLDAKWIAAENIRILTWENGISRISELGEMPKAALREHLMGAGELLRSNVLEPTELFEGPSEQQLTLFETVE